MGFVGVVIGSPSEFQLRAPYGARPAVLSLKNEVVEKERVWDPADLPKPLPKKTLNLETCFHHLPAPKQHAPEPAFRRHRKMRRMGVVKEFANACFLHPGIRSPWRDEYTRTTRGVIPVSTSHAMVPALAATSSTGMRGPKSSTSSPSRSSGAGVASSMI